ncbi:uncharacterized protein LOC114580800 [Dendrobium catenatum]|uniref:uncharacterized protein LOC114580800 n=1 Tax=Dendrobium catenatum TaxID=906689 RepID=UPI00109F8A43|nr:uncharacterized protein LOC114580800 [Dendrobium catenatum]
MQIAQHGHLPIRLSVPLDSTRMSPTPTSTYGPLCHVDRRTSAPSATSPRAQYKRESPPARIRSLDSSSIGLLPLAESTGQLCCSAITSNHRGRWISLRIPHPCAKTSSSDLAKKKPPYARLSSSKLRKTEPGSIAPVRLSGELRMYSNLTMTERPPISWPN